MEAEALNVTAVIVGAIVAFIIGAIIYHPKVLGTIWANGSGVDIEAGGPPPILAFALQLAGLICLSLVIGLTATISYLGTALLAIAAAVLMVVSGGAFLKKSTGALFVDGLYVFLAGAAMIVAQGAL